MNTTTRWTCILLAAFCLAACGGGTSSNVTAAAAPQATSSPPIPTVRTVLAVTVVDEASRPVAGVAVRAPGATGFTDANGVAEFPVTDVPERGTYVSVQPPSPDFYGSSEPLKPTEGRTSVSLRLALRRTVALLAVRGLSRSPLGDRLTVEADVTVLARDGSIETPPAAAFAIDNWDCGWGGPTDCSTGIDGRTVANGGYYQVPKPGTLAVSSLGGGATAPVVAGMLVDADADAARWDPTGLRYAALRRYFSTSSGASVALGTIGASATTPVPPSGFGTDGSRFDSVLTALDAANTAARAELGPVTGSTAAPRVAAPEVFAKIAAMADDAAAAQAAAGSRRHVVAFVRDFPGFNEPCTADTNCRASLDSAIARARAAGVRVVTIGRTYSYYQMADIAVRTGGVHLELGVPEQLDAIVTRALPSLLDGTAPRQRVAFELTAAADTFVVGGTVYGYLSIEVAPGQREIVTLAIPVPAS